MTDREYHLQELQIAKNTEDPRRIMPPILESYRRILDVGCGAGQTLIASHLGAKVCAIGVDRDRSALSLGKQLSNTVHFACARGEALPFADECFDFVFSRVALPYMHVQRTLSEMWRVLRVGGGIWLALQPVSLVVKAIKTNLYRFEIKRLAYNLYVFANGLLINLLGKELSWPLNTSFRESFQTVAGVRHLLRQAGFEEVWIDSNSFLVVTAQKRSTRRLASLN